MKKLKNHQMFEIHEINKKSGENGEFKIQTCHYEL